MKTTASKLELIGLSLFLSGSFFHYMHWPYGTLLLTLAIISISTGMFLEAHRTNSVIRVGENYLRIIFVISSMFWIVNYPGAAMMKILGITSLAMFFVFRLINSFRIEEYWNKIFSILINTTFISLCISFIFSYQAWPYRSIIMVFTFLGIALSSTIFYILSMDKIKNEVLVMKVTPLNRTILAIGLLLVFFNLLNKVPFSTQITSFNECKVLQKENSVLIKQGNALTQGGTDRLSKEVNKLTDIQIEQLQKIKLKLLSETSNDANYQKYKSKSKVMDLEINFDHMNHSFNYDIPMYILQYKTSQNGKSMGEQLHENLVNYRSNLVTILQSKDRKELSKERKILDSNSVHSQKMELESIQSNFYFLTIERTNAFQSDNWVEYYFDHITLINALEKISEIERCILKSRIEAILYLTK